MFPDKDFQPLVESTVVEFAVVFHLPETVSGDSPTVNIVIIIDEKNHQLFMNIIRSFVIDGNRLPGNP